MQQMIDAFIDHLAAEDYSDNTIMAYNGDLKQLRRYLQSIGLASWDQVQERNLMDYILHLKEREYALSTVARKMATVRSFFAFLVANGPLEDNPASGIPLPMIKKSPPTEAPSMEKVERLLAIVEEDQSPKGLRDRALLGLLAEAGLRPSDAVSLNVEDLDLTELTSTLQAALQKYLEEGRPHLTLGEEERALFLSVGVGTGGGRLTRQGAWLIVKKWGKAAGLGGLSPRQLRRVHIYHGNPENRNPEG